MPVRALLSGSLERTWNFICLFFVPFEAACLTTYGFFSRFSTSKNYAGYQAEP